MAFATLCCGVGSDYHYEHCGFEKYASPLHGGIVDAAESISNGKLDIAITVKSEDEIGIWQANPPRLPKIHPN